MVFPGVVWMWELDQKKAEHRRTDAFELWCWRRLSTVPWTARRSKQSILKESVLSITWKDWYRSWNSNTLATWCEELSHLKRPRCWERLRAGEGDDRGWDDWMASPTQWTWVWVNSGSWWWTGRPGVLQFMGSQRVGHDWESELTKWQFVMIHKIRGFSKVNETQLDFFFLELWLYWLINLNYNLLEFHIIYLSLIYNHPTSCCRSLFRSLGEYLCTY